MSRFGDYDGDGDDEFNGNGWAMWQKRAELAINGKRGRKALAELREALMALPEKRLIADALCTVNIERRVEAELPPAPPPTNPEEPFAQWFVEDRERERQHVLQMAEQQGEGVCAIGAYLWYQKVKAGADPQEAFDSLPTLALDGDGGYETAKLGQGAGLTYTLAWELASQNDETWGSESVTPEQRFQKFVDWIDKTLAAPPLARPVPKAKSSPAVHAAAPPPSGSLELGL